MKKFSRFISIITLFALSLFVTAIIVPEVMYTDEVKSAPSASSTKKKINFAGFESNIDYDDVMTYKNGKYCYKAVDDKGLLCGGVEVDAHIVRTFDEYEKKYYDIIMLRSNLNAADSMALFSYSLNVRPQLTDHSFNIESTLPKNGVETQSITAGIGLDDKGLSVSLETSSDYSSVVFSNTTSYLEDVYKVKYDFNNTIMNQVAIFKRRDNFSVNCRSVNKSFQAFSVIAATTTEDEYDLYISGSVGLINSTIYTSRKVSGKNIWAADDFCTKIHISNDELSELFSDSSSLSNDAVLSNAFELAKNQAIRATLLDSVNEVADDLISNINALLESTFPPETTPPNTSASPETIPSNTSVSSETTPSNTSAPLETPPPNTAAPPETTPSNTSAPLETPPPNTAAPPETTPPNTAAPSEKTSGNINYEIEIGRPYYICLDDTDYALTESGKIKNFTNVGIENFNKSNSQKWVIKEYDGDLFIASYSNSDYILNVYGDRVNEVKKCSNIQLYKFTPDLSDGSDTQRVKFVNAGNNKYYIVFSHSKEGYCVDVECFKGDVINENSRVWIYSNNEHFSQKWKFIPAD